MKDSTLRKSGYINSGAETEVDSASRAGNMRRNRRRLLLQDLFSDVRFAMKTLLLKKALKIYFVIFYQSWKNYYYIGIQATINIPFSNSFDCNFRSRSRSPGESRARLPSEVVKHLEFGLVEPSADSMRGEIPFTNVQTANTRPIMSRAHQQARFKEDEYCS